MFRRCREGRTKPAAARPIDLAFGPRTEGMRPAHLYDALSSSRGRGPGRTGCLGFRQPVPSCRWQLWFSHRIIEPVGTLGLPRSGSRSRRNRDAPFDAIPSVARANGPYWTLPMRMLPLRVCTVMLAPLEPVLNSSLFSGDYFSLLGAWPHCVSMCPLKVESEKSAAIPEGKVRSMLPLTDSASSVARLPRPPSKRTLPDTVSRCARSRVPPDRKSTRLNSSHLGISYA